MVTYIYFVKCPGCEDEHFDFFDDAKAFAMGCLSKKPIITQVEVCRNDFGECTDSCDLGTKWSWEDMMKDAEPEDTVFSKDETFGISEGLDDFDDFDIGPQIDEFDNSLDFDFDDDSTDTLWVAENLNGGEIVAACWTDSEDLALRLLSQAFRERTGGDLKDCYIREAEADEPDYIADNPGLLAEALTEDFDRVKAAAQCSRNCYDFYNAIAAKVSDKEIKPYAKAAAKFVKDQYGLTGKAAEDLLWSGYVVWKQLHESNQAVYEAEHLEDFEEAFHYDSLRDKEYDDALDSLDRPLPQYRYTLDPETGKYTSVLVNRDQFTDDELKKLESCERKPIPEGMTIEQLVEEMEENEDTVECVLCQDLFDKSTCRKELNLGWLCHRCADDLATRGEGPVFKSDTYWDFLDENAEPTKKKTWLVFSGDNPIEIGEVYANTEEDAVAEAERKFPDLNYNDYDGAVQVVPADEDLTEASLTDVMAGVNREYGTSYGERDLLDAEGIDDGEFFDDLETQNEINAEVQRRQRQRQAYTINKAKAEREARQQSKVEELRDLGNTYDGGYPAETSKVSDSHLRLCPECGKEAFDIETGICVECGFN